MTLDFFLPMKDFLIYFLYNTLSLSISSAWHLNVIRKSSMSWRCQKRYYSEEWLWIFFFIWMIFLFKSFFWRNYIIFFFYNTLFLKISSARAKYFFCPLCLLSIESLWASKAQPCLRTTGLRSGALPKIDF